MTPAVTNNRSVTLDALRGIAIILVLGRHLHMSDVWERVGWLGVDLFFVLSGFLISGVLFSEFKNTGTLNIWRFWARRVFRIYPPFLVLIAVSELVHRCVYKAWYDRPALVGELTRTQNYGPAIWWQTWSLAVEEHFYFVLPLVLLYCARRKTSAPFKQIPIVVAAVAVAELTLRIVTTIVVPPFIERVHAFPSHLRVDSLACGVLISYLYHFHRTRLMSEITRYKPLLILGASGCLIPMTIWDMADPFIRTVGLTLSYAAFGQVLLLSLTASGNKMLLRAIATIGRWSYSIYLWHVFVLVYVPGAAHRLGIHELSPVMLAGCYIIGAICGGCVMHAVIEQPAIRLRDRLFRGDGRPSAVAVMAASSGAPA